MGHCTLADPAPAPASEPAADPHAGHAIHGASTAAPPVAPPPAEALSGPAHAQDLFFDPGQAARSRAAMAQEGLIHGESRFPVSITLLVALALLLVGVAAFASIVFGVAPFG